MRKRRSKSNDKTDAQKPVTAAPDDSQAREASGPSALQAALIRAIGFNVPSKMYDVDNRYMQPPIYFRTNQPFAALIGGFRLESGDDTSDVTTSNAYPDGIDGDDYLDPETANFYTTLAAQTFEPATPMAYNFVRLVWPHYDRLFRTSLRQSGTEVSFNHFLAIVAMMIKLQSYVLDAKALMALANPIGLSDWDEIAGDFGQAFGLSQARWQKRLESVMITAAGIPCIKGIATEVSRIKSPFFPIGADGSLCVPMELPPSQLNNTIADFDSSRILEIFTKIDTILELLRGDFSNEVAAMKHHMPYTFGDIPWTDIMAPTPDPFKTDGLLNSDFNTLNVAGNEGDDSYVNVVYINEDSTSLDGFLAGTETIDQSKVTVNNGLHTVFPETLPLLSMLSSTVWVADSDAVDAEFALLTPHVTGLATIPYRKPGVVKLKKFGNSAEDYLSLTAGLEHLRRPLLAHSISVSGVDLYMPSANRTTIDLQVYLNGLEWFTQFVFDVTVVTAIDSLSQTASAPVVHPAVAGLR